MKLSELIWNGSKRHPQAVGSWEGRNAQGELTTCAIMAALEEAGVVIEKDGCFDFSRMAPSATYTDRVTGKKLSTIPEGTSCWSVPDWFAQLTNVMAIYPCACALTWGGHRKKATFFQIIPHLNDAHEWTREAVAMWVESIEKKVEAKNAKAEKDASPKAAASCVPDGEHLLERTPGAKG